MRVLITGLRGVGKSTIGKLVSESLGWKWKSVGDFMLEYSKSVWPDIDREQLQEKLTTPVQLAICTELAKLIASFDNLIIEAQTVVSGDFGIMIPTDPVFGRTGLGCIILLVAKPKVIIERRAGDSKRRAGVFLSEKRETLALQQQLSMMFVIASSVKLGINSFVIDNSEEPSISTASVLNAICIAREEQEFVKKLLKNSGPT